MKPKNSETEFIVTLTLIVADIARSVAFYRDVLGAMVLREGEPTLLRLQNIWITINNGGGGTDDKPEVIASPPKDLNMLSSFINLRVADIQALLRAMAFARGEVHHRAKSSSIGKALLHARSRRISDRSGSNDIYEDTTRCIPIELLGCRGHESVPHQ